MPIDTRKYVLIDLHSGQVLSDATMVAPQLVGAHMYDIGADYDLLAEYAEQHGIDLYAPGDAVPGDKPGIEVTHLENFMAIDLDAGTVHMPASLRIASAESAGDLVDDPAVAKAAALQGQVPLVPAAVHDLEGLPFLDVSE